MSARESLRVLTACLLLMTLPGAATVAQAPPAAPAAPAAQPAPENAGRQPGSHDRRRAAKFYIEASKLYMDAQFEAAMHSYEQAAALDPARADYRLAADVARNHAVMALIQTAAKDRLTGNAAGARAALAHALELDPKNPEVTQHLYELGDDAVRGQSEPVYRQGANSLRAADLLQPAAGTHSFHSRGEQRQVIVDVFNAFGVTAMLDDSVRMGQVRLDLDDVGFARATQILAMLTNTFYAPLDAHRVVVAANTRENRQRLMRQEMETVSLGGMSDTEVNDIGTIAKNIFGIQQVSTSVTAQNIMLRAPASTLSAFNATLRELAAGRNQVMIEVRLIQLAHTSTRNTGAQMPQSMGVFNVAAEAESILNANQSLVQQIISSGLASPNDYWTILAILIASGQVSNSLLTSGFATFGGNLSSCTSGNVMTCKGALTTFGLVPGSTSMNLNLNSSDSRELDNIQMRLGDGEDGTLKEGSKYPIQTSSFSNLSSNVSNIAGLTGAGTSSALTSLLSSLSGTASTVPMIQYQDLGLTLKVTPKVMRNNDVALSIDMKIDSLSGSSIDGNPILNSQTYAGVVTVQEGQAIELVSELDRSQSRAVSGSPGIGEIPGLNSTSSKDVQKNYAKLLILIRPHVIRGTQPAGHTPMIRIEKEGNEQ